MKRGEAEPDIAVSITEKTRICGEAGKPETISDCPFMSVKYGLVM
jgi:hypothetical protein